MVRLVIFWPNPPPGDKELKTFGQTHKQVVGALVFKTGIEFHLVFLTKISKISGFLIK